MLALKLKALLSYVCVIYIYTFFFIIVSPTCSLATSVPCSGDGDTTSSGGMFILHKPFSMYDRICKRGSSTHI